MAGCFFAPAISGFDFRGGLLCSLGVRLSLRVLLVLMAVFAGPAARAARPGKSWEVLEDCRLAADKYFDGDSFHIQHGRQTLIVRLYFVDAPETAAGLGDRVKGQAAYYRVTEPAVLRGGRAAKDFTERFLSKPFRVITRRQAAPGASKETRYYGIVEQGGKRLDAALVEAGLGAPTSPAADYPDATGGQRAGRELRALQAKAAQEKRGLWQRAGTVETLKDALKPRLTPGAPATPAARLINLNTATADELAALPGVGPKTAAQIIRARPLKDLAALDALPGFGPKRIEALRELVGF